ncbi:secretory pathway Sec39 [Dothidotthia symphoricarpi CBS 119687]|uniref:Secretory pathway Sec39 n=1 Tax=Dothidotthia symphoricarpi CBS 119687 TaxID=1392245 RepID=A0A6A6A399_9PLEO|nr:secretory pathway Sec39 [Dothidotthia symphoricarpi CBS 119687]KAF2125655.1 secretory pathway Sec39 [Dothidotthia symphoricarpi CBS 119687]
MATPQKLQKLSGPHCVLLAVQYATESNITSLRVLTALREAHLPLELVLSILLTYLPEETDPVIYRVYLNELAMGSRNPGEGPTASLNISSVEGQSDSRAKKKRKALELLPLSHPLYATETELDAFSHFLIHRAHRIDAQTGLLDLVPQLVTPFLGHSEYLRTWFISTVLPLLRLSYEYYPQTATSSLDEFAPLKGRRAVEYQLSNLHHERRNGGDNQHLGRDLRGVVAPWMCGATERKRRRLTGEARRASITEQPPQEPDDWACLFDWLVRTSKQDLSLVTRAITEWDGPEDMDLGGYEEGRDYIDDDTQRRLEIQYAQTALASLYLVEKNDVETVKTAHSLLRRIFDLLNYDPPPELDIDVEALPSYDLQDPLLHESTTAVLTEERLLEFDNVLTTPGQSSARVLELVLFSAWVLSSLQQSESIRKLAKMSLRDDYPEQLSLLQKILHRLGGGSKKDSDQWIIIRSKLLWLWNWGTDSHEQDRHAQGIIGMLERKTVETEILKALLESSNYPLIVQTYIQSSSQQAPLPLADVEKVILKSVMHHYDNASNGNRTRGGMKRAADIVTAFSPHFAASSRFQRTQALLSATHAMSFYSLILQHGVPFQPVNIRVSSDPLALIQKLLSQNLSSYTKLDDLITIGQNLVISMPATIMDEDDDDELSQLDTTAIESKKAAAERRVIGMAIDAALEEGDFETAYSYVVNRLSLPTPSLKSPKSFHHDPLEQDDSAEDVPWQAALRAGSYTSSSNSWSYTSHARPDLRRLEQRMDLLSQALLLAPPSHLEEILSVWTQCETEMTNLLAQETEAETRFNDAADRKLPGAFTNDTITVQPRREVGRGAAEEAPMGLFDVTRAATAALSKSVFPLRSNTQMSKEGTGGSSRASMDLSDAGSHEDRVRRRDLVANAATGALASGLGWMLGAKPVND